jgi:hypothetical protein
VQGRSVDREDARCWHDFSEEKFIYKPAQSVRAPCTLRSRRTHRSARHAAAWSETTATGSGTTSTGTTSTGTRARPLRIRSPMPACSAMRPTDPGTRETAIAGGVPHGPMMTGAALHGTTMTVGTARGGAAAAHDATMTVGAARHREGAAHHEGVGRAATARRAAATARHAAATAAAAAAARRGSGSGRDGTTWARTARR